MLGLGLLDKVEFTRISNAVAAGVTTIECTKIDMANKDVVLFAVALGVVTNSTVSKLKLMGSDDDVTYEALTADDESTICELALADDDDNKILIVEVIRPQTRYVRLDILRTIQNVVVDGVVAITANVRNIPTTNARSSKFISPLVV